MRPRRCDLSLSPPLLPRCHSCRASSLFVGIVRMDALFRSCSMLHSAPAVWWSQAGMHTSALVVCCLRVAALRVALLSCSRRSLLWPRLMVRQRRPRPRSPQTHTAGPHRSRTPHSSSHSCQRMLTAIRSTLQRTSSVVLPRVAPPTLLAIRRAMHASSAKVRRTRGAGECSCSIKSSPCIHLHLHRIAVPAPLRGRPPALLAIAAYRSSVRVSGPPSSHQHTSVDPRAATGTDQFSKKDSQLEKDVRCMHRREAALAGGCEDSTHAPFLLFSLSSCSSM